MEDRRREAPERLRNGRAEKEHPYRDGIGRRARGDEGDTARATPAIRARDLPDHRRHVDHRTLLAGPACSVGRHAATVSARAHHAAMISRSWAAGPSSADGGIPQSAITPTRSFPFRMGTVRSAP